MSCEDLLERFDALPADEQAANEVKTAHAEIRRRVREKDRPDNDVAQLLALDARCATIWTGLQRNKATGMRRTRLLLAALFALLLGIGLYKWNSQSNRSE